MMSKNYVALARVSSDEQQREGFSLDIQEDALRDWAAKNKGVIRKMYRVTETAHKSDRRTIFREMLAYAKSHATELNGLLFYKVDRAARNMGDWVELLKLRDDYGLQVICITERFDETPAGKLNANMLAAISQFYSDQLSVRTQEGVLRRVQNGLFPGHAPYGYRNYRENGRGLVAVHEEHAPKVRRIFELYAYRNHTIDGVSAALEAEGVQYRAKQSKFTRSKLHTILRDRSYIGEVLHRGQWHPGIQDELVDRGLFNRVQALLGDKNYNAHKSVYGSGMIHCGHCGKPIVVEIKTKKTKRGEKEYRYYRCSEYTSSGHPRVRVNESVIEEQVLALFERMRIEDEKVQQWIVKVIHAKARDSQRGKRTQLDALRGQLRNVEMQRDRLLNLRLLGEIDSELFTRKETEFRDRQADLSLQIEAANRQGDELGGLAVKVFELSQALHEKWVTADIPEKRQLLEIICLNFSLDGVTLAPEMRKPFDMVAKGLLVQDGSGGRI